MRIGLVTDQFYPEIGGTENHVRLLARELDRRGLHVKIITSKTHGSETKDWVDGLEVLRLTTMLSMSTKSQHLLVVDPLAVNGIQKAIRTYGLDLVHAHNTISASAIRAARNMGKPVVATVHDTWAIGCFRRDFLFQGKEQCTGRLSCGRCILGLRVLDAAIDRYRESYRRELAKADRLTTPSKYMARLLMSFGYPSSSVDIVPNFTDFSEQIRRYAIDPTQNPKGPIILYVGALAFAKGPQVLLRALPKVISNHPRVQVRFVGRGDLLRSLMLEAHRLGVSRNVVFRGSASGEALLREYASSTVVVMPSLAPESSGTVILEAMAFGKPVIASAVGAIPETIEDGLTGLLFRWGDPTDLARAVTRILDNNELARLITQRSQETVRMFSPDKASDAYVKIYRQIVDA